MLTPLRRTTSMGLHPGSRCLQVQQLTTEKLLDGIQLYRVHSAAEVMAVVQMLPDLLAAAPEVCPLELGGRQGIVVVQKGVNCSACTAPRSRRRWCHTCWRPPRSVPPPTSLDAKTSQWSSQKAFSRSYCSMVAAWLDRGPLLQVKLVVLDSVAFPFRHGFTDMVLRTRTLGDMGNRLMQLANERDVAVRDAALTCSRRGDQQCTDGPGGAGSHIWACMYMDT